LFAYISIRRLKIILNIKEFLNMFNIGDCRQLNSCEMRNLEQSLGNGSPFYPSAERSLGIEEGANLSLLACARLNDALYSGKDQIIGYSDPDDPIRGEDKYISFRNKYDQPSFGVINPNSPTTDIGVRGINHSFQEPANRATVVHSHSILEQLLPDSTGRVLLNLANSLIRLTERRLRGRIIIPYLGGIAALHNLNPVDYIYNFYPQVLEPSPLEASVTRAILYHDTSDENSNVYKSPDGQKEAIRAHNDKSAFTVDIQQTGPGLQYLLNGKWEDSPGGLCIFPSAGDQHLETSLKPVTHRVVELGNGWVNGLSRAALIAFINSCSTNDHVIPLSESTHPL
jgi:hypothetical protein